MRLPTTTLLVILSVVAYAQTESTLVIKKHTTTSTEVKEYRKIFATNLNYPYDTICSLLTLNLTPLQGMYDSMSLYNLKHTQTAGINTHFYTVQGTRGNAIITFYKKQENGSYQMIYYRNWTIKCRE